MRDLRLIVVGSRNINDYDLIKKTCLNVICDVTKLKHLDEKIPKENILIVCGDEPGVERLAKRFANTYELKTKTFEKKQKYGLAALSMRNIDMVNYLLKTNNWYDTFLVIVNNNDDVNTENVVRWIRKLKYQEYNFESESML